MSIDGIERSHHLITLSARSQQAVCQAMEKLKHHLDEEPDQNLGDLAYTLHVGREEFDHRITVVAKSHEELKQLCEQVEAEGVPDVGTTGAVAYRKRSSAPPKVAFLFSGQGSQYIGMGQTLYESSSVFREVCDACFELVNPYYPIPFQEYMFNPQYSLELNHLNISSTAMFVIEYALARLWMSWGVTPDYVIGHSLGEYVAACVAGGLSLHDALLTVVKRGALMQEGTESGALLAVNGTWEMVQSYLAPFGEDVSVATVNGPQHYVIAGRREAVERLDARLEADGVVHRLLPLSTASHSVLMEPILGEYREFMEQQIAFSPIQIPLVSNLTGEVVEGRDLDAPYWCRHLRDTVQFAAGIQTLLDLGIDTFLEIGPHPMLTSFVESMPLSAEQVAISSLNRKEPPWKTMQESLAQLWLAGATIDWQAFDREWKRKRVHAPTYAFDLRSCWVDHQPARQAQHETKPWGSTGTDRDATGVAVAESKRVAVVRSPEEWVRAIWREVLGLQEIAPDDNFLYLGGDSLNLIQVQSRLNRALQLRLNLRDLYRNTSFADLVALLQAKLDETACELAPESLRLDEQIDLVGEVPLSHIQQWLFVSSRMDPEYFFMPVCLETSKSLQPEWLQQALQILHDHHDMLRATYKRVAGGVQQILLAPEAVEVELLLYDLTDLAGQQEQEAAFQRLEVELAESITFEKGLMNRAALVKMDDDRHRILWVVSHLYTDNVSSHILPQDLIAVYEQLEQGEEAAQITLGEKSASYKQWVEMCRSFINSERGADVFSYWEPLLQKATETRMELGCANEPNALANLKSRSWKVDAKRTAILRQNVPEQFGTSIKEVLTALVAHSLSNWLGQEQICFAINGHGRDVLAEDQALDLSRTVGYFINTYPCYEQVADSQSISQTIQQMQERLHRMPHGGASFHMLRYLSDDPQIREAMQHYEDPEVLLNYHGELLDLTSTTSEWREFEPSNLEQPMDHESQYKLIVSGYIQGGELIVHFTYLESQLSDTSIERLEQLFDEQVQNLIKSSEGMLT
ncbi:condensation domain-containing protein [Tumebacillus permanentifrigoris]|uniref:Non-ribosomal peptide synthase protein (TIGR01720 family) n=1 Tax=Tumebacillus permanentifrigoris TaxID=378543 RepID=A0A316DCL5_9BACL|nr:condensation domain-containing protein [Tumebacillus permanentifrigoris]PWK15685.1 non-ribosomal peptide synthase protein (TIGR01720 family) [Tumebacillus permanentifrigoris]